MRARKHAHRGLVALDAVTGSFQPQQCRQGARLPECCLAGGLTGELLPIRPPASRARHVLPGKSCKEDRPPEPRAQVRILPGALVICTNSNALTTLTQPKPRPLNCGDPACAGPYGQNAVSPRKGVRHHERAEDLHTGGAGRRAVL